MQLHLLLIDDDLALLLAFSDMIAFHFPNIQVTAVESGRAALVAAKVREYDLVICDLLMPGMDGAQTLVELRKDHPHLRMYLMTGHPEPQKAYKFTTATGFLKKPLDRAYFLEFMKRTSRVISLGKRATATVTRATQHLSSVLRVQQREQS